MLEVFLELNLLYHHFRDGKEAIDASSSCDICSVLGFFQSAILKSASTLYNEL